MTVVARRRFHCGGTPTFSLWWHADVFIVVARRRFHCGGTPTFSLWWHADVFIVVARRRFHCGGTPLFAVVKRRLFVGSRLAQLDQRIGTA
jgi:hypothetical protein